MGKGCRGESLGEPGNRRYNVCSGGACSVASLKTKGFRILFSICHVVIDGLAYIV